MIILMWKRKVLRTRDKEIVDLADAGTMRYIMCHWRIWLRKAVTTSNEDGPNPEPCTMLALIYALDDVDRWQCKICSEIVRF